MFNKTLIGLSVLIVSSGAFAGDSTHESHAMAVDAAVVSQENVSNRSELYVRARDLEDIVNLRVQRREAEYTLTQDVQAGNIQNAQAELASIHTLTARVREAENTLASTDEALSVDRIDRAMDRAELDQDVRELTGHFRMREEMTDIRNPRIEADQSALEAAIAQLNTLRQQRMSVLQSMDTSVEAGNITTAQTLCSAADAIKAEMMAQANTVFALHRSLVNDNKAAKAAQFRFSELKGNK